VSGGDRDVELLRGLLRTPTAPFREEAIVRFVRGWAGAAGVAFGQDGSGNVLLRYRRGRPRARWVFAAHMDHPGFEVRESGGRTVLADFRGGVGEKYFDGARVRLFPAAGDEAVGTIRRSEPLPVARWRSCRIRLDGPADVPVGTPGMWDLPAFRVRGNRYSGRAFDDLAGVAAVLAAMERIAADRPVADVTGLLTRAEEAAFVGCLAASREGSVADDAFVVALEASQIQPAAKLGDGVVVRVGDAMRVYDPSLTGYVHGVAAELADREDAFRYVRRLMPGGVCEAAAYCLAGYRATGLCLPLGNYHNQGPKGRIAPERIDAGDFASLVRLLTALPTAPGSPEVHDRKLAAAMRERLRTRKKYLK
jgi:endoglucanase